MGRPEQAIVRHGTSSSDRTHYIPFKGQAIALDDIRPLSSMLHSMLQPWDRL